jgi:hypothetical protein
MNHNSDYLIGLPAQGRRILVMNDISTNSLDILTAFPEGNLALFRRFELAAALNRLRSLQTLATQQAKDKS